MIFLFLLNAYLKFEFDLGLKILLIFFVSIILSGIISGDNILKSFLYLRFFILLLIVYMLNANKIIDEKKIYFVYGLFALIVSADVIFQFFTTYNIIGFEREEYVSTSFFKGEKIAGSYIHNFAYFALFGFFLKSKKDGYFSEIIIALMLSIILLGIFFSGNRMAMVIFLGCLILRVLLSRKHSLKIFLSTFIFFVIVSIFANKTIILSYKSFYANSLNILNISKYYKKIEVNKKTNKDGTQVVGSGHKEVFNSSINVWSQKKIFGVGIKNFYIACYNKKFSVCANHPHNYYLDVLISTGIVGFSTFFVFLIYASTTILKQYSKRFSFTYEEKEFLLLFALMLFSIFFPLQSAGSFFTTGNASFIFLTIGLFLGHCIKIKHD